MLEVIKLREKSCQYLLMLQRIKAVIRLRFIVVRMITAL